MIRRPETFSFRGSFDSDRRQFLLTAGAIVDADWGRVEAKSTPSFMPRSLSRSFANIVCTWTRQAHQSSPEMPTELARVCVEHGVQRHVYNAVLRMAGNSSRSDTDTAHNTRSVLRRV